MLLTKKEWWKASLTRAVRTICQTAVAAIGSAVILSEVNWIMVGSASVLAGILSLLMSIGGLPEVGELPEADPSEQADG